MTMYREILRLHFEGGLSQRDIAASCRCAHSTVKRILARAAELELDFNKIKELSDNSLARMIYPQAILPRIQKEPDYALSLIHIFRGQPALSIKLLNLSFITPPDFLANQRLRVPTS